MSRTEKVRYAQSMRLCDKAYTTTKTTTEQRWAKQKREWHKQQAGRVT